MTPEVQVIDPNAVATYSLDQRVMMNAIKYLEVKGLELDPSMLVHCCLETAASSVTWRGADVESDFDGFQQKLGGNALNLHANGKARAHAGLIAGRRLHSLNCVAQIIFSTI
ncbi:hypothetical protein EVAR_54942_1 [Eumeta japonica]|uniref:Uncharacterized protein n=1 Tax=Eumeta variegata TaxID=151549 RepID=A0A4C1YJ24_EUMVA|nr:hypothetical protein EVAR_54942_1 [Eumeta japonica]